MSKTTVKKLIKEERSTANFGFRCKPSSKKKWKKQAQKERKSPTKWLVDLMNEACEKEKIKPLQIQKRTRLDARERSTTNFGFRCKPSSKKKWKKQAERSNRKLSEWAIYLMNNACDNFKNNDI